ncbi:CaiB/BaiF CoA transferase family protein [Porphyrobacter sp. CACIAM 03H1]|uniref:CaiB/BaiF CoA transferase family protein n=1 Tax=Porphyrobacter sp. CACIAM 03H1 TaxID=2003315 RepID=UPI000B5ABC33|nr:CaiB/BaiF CoA-transferase family protein [Porphyrobacter sp. CACIAM 03H1]ASJ92376.1 carnitine dehydratase [Porphyrobacter sp. CACIAM 03H1]
MSQPKGPLAGLRVLEFAGIGPGPHVAMLLADLGAEVVRIDRPGSVSTNPVVDRARHRLALDLKSEEGKAQVRAAAASADVLIEGFRPGVMERLGLGPDDLLMTNPRLVYARMTGWGQEGPLAQAAGHDINYIAITGALAAVGRAGETATPPQNLVGDFGGGSMYCAFGIMAALYERERSGKGQVVDAAIVDGATSLMSFFFGVRHLPHLSTERGKGMLGGAAHFYRCFTCADGKEISLGSIEPQFYAELLQRAGAPQELAQGQMNPANWDDHAEKLAALFAKKTRDEWCELLEGTDACFAPVLGIEEAREHPHMKARAAYVEHDGIWHTAPAPRFSRTPGAVRSSTDDGAEVVARWAEAG